MQRMLTKHNAINFRGCFGTRGRRVRRFFRPTIVHGGLDPGQGQKPSTIVEHSLRLRRRATPSGTDEK